MATIRLSELTRKKVGFHKDMSARQVQKAKAKAQKKAQKRGEEAPDEVDDFKKVGRIHMAVFSPKGTRLVGYLVKRPDVAGMVKRPDLFVAYDSLEREGDRLFVTDEKDGVDDAARKRLGLDWDRCVMWAGMDARTEAGRNLGFVSDVSFDPQTGKVESYFVGDGGVAESLVGALPIPAHMLRGYSKGYMVVDNAAKDLQLTGGAAAKAGEGYAKAKIKGAAASKKFDDKASVAVDKGSKALGKQLGKTKGMFSSFMDEYRKASR